MCCNAFRYGQCNTQVKCSGGVHCRVVSCVPPYQWEACSTTSFRSDSTANHSSPYLPQWGPMEKLYTQMGGHKSFLGASMGPIKAVMDGSGKYVNYQGGRIWWSSRTGASALSSGVMTAYVKAGGPSAIGYPKGAQQSGLRDSGWLQLFEKGCLTDSASTYIQCVFGWRWTMWVAAGRENGPLGYPTAAVQNFSSPSGSWIQLFQGGCIVFGGTTPRAIVHTQVWVAWQAQGRETGVLGYPTGDRSALTRGYVQRFQRGGIWGLTDQPAFAVRGPVLTAWEAEGGADGRYGYPTAHVVDNGDGTFTGTFEGGTITA